MLQLYKNLVKPIVNRLGTIAATWLIAKGVDADLAGQFANALTALGFIAFDLFLSWRDRSVRP